MDNKRILVILVVVTILAQALVEATSPVGPDPCPPGVCNCPRNYKPVCASDGRKTKIFSNACRVKCAVCDTRISLKIVDMSLCS
ncbi:unnamed protein product [Notodromas monacha]|uniref:Kazal-like domain-containing protein n=1 Tax=Notodromas monacha TaxID=399045 RepID=A0A7R9BHC4_9CRUS|nr:unnamed protein product [Notodromas monacha]CAG0915244.1 unnamed protein product [Notodromas monacha]